MSSGRFVSQHSWMPKLDDGQHTRKHSLPVHLERPCPFFGGCLTTYQVMSRTLHSSPLMSPTRSNNQPPRPLRLDSAQFVPSVTTSWSPHACTEHVAANHRACVRAAMDEQPRRRVRKQVRGQSIGQAVSRSLSQTNKQTNKQTNECMHE